MKTTTIGNDALYRRGRQLADQIVPLVASGVGRESALRRAAAASGLSVEDAKAADGFRKAADRIAKDAGPRAMAMILSGRGRLAPELVVKISNTHRERREFAMFRLAQGLDPFDKAIAWKAPPFDTGDYRVALDRVSLSAGLLDRAAAGLARASVEDLIAIGDHLAAARAFDAATSAALGGGAGGDPRPPAPAPGPRRPARRPTDPPPVGNKDARRLAHKVRGLAARNVRDTPRLMTEAPPTDAERDALLAALATSGSASEALSRLIEARIALGRGRGRPRPRRARGAIRDLRDDLPQRRPHHRRPRREAGDLPVPARLLPVRRQCAGGCAGEARTPPQSRGHRLLEPGLHEAPLPPGGAVVELRPRRPRMHLGVRAREVLRAVLPGPRLRRPLRPAVPGAPLPLPDHASPGRLRKRPEAPGARARSRVLPAAWGGLRRVVPGRRPGKARAGRATVGDPRMKFSIQAADIPGIRSRVTAAIMPT